MTGWTGGATARRASLTLWLAGTGLCGISCRDDAAEPSSPGTAVEAGPALTATAPGPKARTVDLTEHSATRLSDTWVPRRGVPIPRLLSRAGTLNGIIYVVGNLNKDKEMVFAYDVAANLWSSRKSLPSGRASVNGVSAIGGRLYVTGGAISNGPLTKTLFIYTPGPDTWVRKADMPEVGGCGAQGVIAGLLYVYSACDGSRFFQYNPATNTWITLAPPPTSHDFGGSGVIGGKFYLVGGQHAEAGVNVPHTQLDVYDPATDTWTTRAPMPARAIFMASAVLNGNLLVAGGQNHGGELATLTVYSPSTNVWTTKSPMPTSRTFAAGAAAGGRFFVIGGRANGLTTRKVLAYTP